ncbi:rhodanese-like domain-containing protein [Ruminococcus sp. YH-rum2234]|uniref:Rhodanese-like domain-containing protein n=1 Tax=Fusibacillus kribbianus TaxID=3044208 RepID=A0AAP4BA83_9FIRM|nr:rhodanese-like domain-containing protein [Ruminococcus sp. YH-rum2234]MDI9242881.1 rhodanese-like domain-containing protein [Ruminococcus sp. YH-rum2234]
MKRIFTVILIMITVLTGCGGKNVEKNTYQQISQDKAKQMMEEQEDAIVLDVREKEEYETGHIPGAVLLPLGTIDEDSAASVIPKKDSVVLVYCRSGRRSKQASQALAELGYTQIYEFGGINDWPYEVE